MAVTAVPRAVWPGVAPRVSATALFGVLTSLLLIGAVALARRTLGGRLGAVACLATLGWLPVVFWVVLVARVPIVESSGAARATDLPMAALVSGVLLTPLVWVSSSLSAWARSSDADRVIRRGAWGSLAVVALAASLALIRVGRPDADTYVASLPVVPASPVDFLQRGAPGLDYRWHAALPDVVTVHRDVRLDLWIVDDDFGERFAFVGAAGRARGLEDSDVAPFLAPPTGWTLGAVAGLAFQVLLIACARRAERRPADAMLEGTLQAGDWVAIPGRPPIHVPEMAGLAPGPVVLRLRDGAASTYRDTGASAVESWQAGTLEQARDARAGRITTLYALALTSGLLSAAPLLLSGLGGAR